MSTRSDQETATPNVEETSEVTPEEGTESVDNTDDGAENTDTSNSSEDGETSTDEASEESVEELPSVEELLKERDELRGKVEEWKGLYYKINEAFQKKNSEVQETRKRLEKTNEINQARLRGQVVSNIFNPFENLKRSIDACTKAGVDEGLTSGLVMVKEEFWTAFEKLGLEEIPGVGSLFNPNIHEALTTMPVQDPVLNDTVVQVYTTGYRINDTVIRTAQVIVGKYYAPVETVEETEDNTAASADEAEESSSSQEE